jgi:aminopeptidase N
MTILTMRGKAALLLLAVLLLAAVFQSSRVSAQRAQTFVHHDLRITLEPATHRLVVSDRITLPDNPTSNVFSLNSRLTVTKATPVLEEMPAGKDPVRKRYRPRTADRTLVLEYSGAIDFGLSDQKEEYTRGFRETSGIVSLQGVYLAGGSAWYPQFGDGLVTFDMQVQAPAGWQVISEGSGGPAVAGQPTRWQAADPIDEIHLTGGPLVVSRARAGDIDTFVYLHEKDDALAGRYLDTGAQYLRMFSDLIGPYPYSKFALVENFWETGYGMPSFTLLGPEVIRFPFILHSSFPHEILHNWWGNGVFVDEAGGNWCEGLTAYLADHLVQEQRALGHEYRRGTLQKYRDYVKEGRDFPLSSFRGRNSAATEAVGYGKALMTFHMLRRSLGDDGFRTMLARFYKEYRGRRASWADVERLAETVAGKTLAPFFAQWVTRTGAPVLRVRATVAPAAATVPGSVAAAPGFVMTGAIEQTQGGTPYRLVVPVIVQTAQGIVSKDIVLADAAGAFTITVPAEPVSLHVDPYFDVFRALDPRETPPSVGQIFGEPRITAVLPSSAPPDRLTAYRALLAGWQSESHAIEVVLDSEIRGLPADRSVWLIGRENRFAEQVFRGQAGFSADAAAFVLHGKSVSLAGHSAVVVTRHPADAGKAVGWIVADPLQALAGIGRKLPHYGKYSYLGFEGADATNIVSGQWTSVDSPLTVDLREPGARGGALPALAPPDRKALAELPGGR